MTIPCRPVVVFNPSKATDPAARRAEVLGAFRRIGLPEPEWLETTVDDPGRTMTEAALRAGADAVFACGGDGTVRACVAAMAGTDIPLAVLAAGTGNLLAGNLDIPVDLDDALALVVAGSVRPIDVGAAGDERFAVMGGLGFDAAMIADADETLKARIGWAAYILSGLQNLRRPAVRYRLTLDDGEVFERSARGVLVGNVGRLEAGLPVLPDAQPDDGLLDVAVLAPVTLRDWAGLAVRIVGRRRPKAGVFETMRAHRIRIEVYPAQPLELDGDTCASQTELTIDVIPSALRVFAPQVGGPGAPSSAPTTAGQSR